MGQFDSTECNAAQFAEAEDRYYSRLAGDFAPGRDEIPKNDLMEKVAHLLTRGRARGLHEAIAICPAKKIVDESWGESMTQDELNRITDLCRIYAETGKTDEAEIGRIVLHRVIQYAKDCIPFQTRVGALRAA